ncbi:hypothetical protein HMPREF1557_01311 [Streptococcus sobrinus W1703]|uniref:Uncharacterized protein n=1 Tax=Streptococcus sobrinus W1703 TaxID=1227275 RepID=U2J884_9STRE|nr:hypothetical protein HMPREF1557_01311 [Streptococcus sobrinus W1703]
MIQGQGDTFAKVVFLATNTVVAKNGFFETEAQKIAMKLRKEIACNRTV